MRDLLTRLHRNGPTILAFGIVLGLAVPSLAELARPALPATVFAFVLGTLLRVEPSAILAQVRRPRIALALPCAIAFLAPALAAVAVSLAGLPADLALAIVLGAAAPPTTTTIAVARMLGLDGAPPLAAMLVATFAAPLTVPLVADLFGGPRISALDLAQGLVLLVGGAIVTAALLRRFAAGPLARNGVVIDAAIVVSLLVFSLATMAGVRASIEAEPAFALGVIALAYATNLGLQAVGAALFPGDGATRLVTGLTLGNKNVGLVWAALGAQISPTMALYFAACQLPIFTLPRAAQWVLGAIRRREARYASTGRPTPNRGAPR
ncbi:hypothetical protein ACTZWW_00155 [Salinarimonas sp. NSM]|uniref:hypothetical protein n=1 Tax=Salinarimonas sp. NSM TaxID=3458003 RepID=UPI004037331B